MENKQLTNWQTVGIGALMAFVPTLFWSLYGAGIEPFALYLSSMFGGVAGAFVGKKWRKSQGAIWMWALLGAFLGIPLWVLIVLFSLLVVEGSI